MRWHFAPSFVLTLCLVCYLALAGLLIWLATAQPWLGVDLEVRGATVVIAATAPAAIVPDDLRGARLVSIRSENAQPITLRPVDLIEEPDTLETAALREFYDRQDRLFHALSGGPVTLEIESDGRSQMLSLRAADHRPPADLPMKFWMQVFVALIGLTIGTWVACMRPREGAVWMFLLAGVGLALSSGAAAIYSSRELALAQEVFSAANVVNSLGVLLFGVGMVTLFLIYPRRIVPRAVVALPALIVTATGLIQFAQWPEHLDRMKDVIAALMVVLLLAITAQVVANRRDPAARAMLGWLGLSVAAGAGGFVLTSIVPILLGQGRLVEQSTAFLFFLIIYGGLAMAVSRYRLFDLATWSFGVLYYGFGVALLLVLDAVLIFGLSLGRAPALGISVALIGLIYLPLRDKAARLLHRNRDIPAEELYRRVTKIAHARDPGSRQALLQTFWRDLFNPLAIEAVQDTTVKTALVDDGRALTLARVGGLKALRLDMADQGARLFSSRDLARVRSIQSLIDTSLRQHQTYIDAVMAERVRINRDMHDNIGVLLLNALHTPGTERKDLLIRQTLTDLREIVSNPDQAEWHLAPLIADLRAEIAELLDAAQMTVSWQGTVLPDVSVAPLIVHTLRAFLREGVANVVRHSQAIGVTISVMQIADTLHLALGDNGRGFDMAQIQPGNGFRNLSDRVEQAGGAFDLSSGQTGTTMTARLPLGLAFKAAAE